MMVVRTARLQFVTNIVSAGRTYFGLSINVTKDRDLHVMRGLPPRMVAI
jgi:hypothetical protein